jgi:hypothetical protein
LSNDLQLKKINKRKSGATVSLIMGTSAEESVLWLGLGPRWPSGSSGKARPTVGRGLGQISGGDISRDSWAWVAAASLEFLERPSSPRRGGAGLLMFWVFGFFTCFPGAGITSRTSAESCESPGKGIWKPQSPGHGEVMVSSVENSNSVFIVNAL